jgi:hypothetical protein
LTQNPPAGNIGSRVGIEPPFIVTSVFMSGRQMLLMLKAVPSELGFSLKQFHPLALVPVTFE